MDDNLPEIQDRAEAPQVPSSLLGSEWASPDDIMPPLAACFALVRPAGMGNDAAAEWLAVATGELVGYQTASVLAALAYARRNCTHHSQIVPHVIRILDEQANLYCYTGRREAPRRLPGELRDELPPNEIAGLIEATARALKDGNRG